MKVRCRGSKFSFAVVRKLLPNGSSVDCDVVEHPGAVLILPFLTRDQLIFLYQYRPVLGRFLLELPAGTLNACERPLACAHRELIEETDYAAGQLTRLGQIYPVPGYSTEIIHIFKAQRLVKKQGVKDPDETIEAKVLNKSQVQNLVRTGRIMDAKTLAALGLCGWLSLL